MLAPAAYYDRYHAITVPDQRGGEDLASSVVVDRYRLGAQQPYIDERYKLGKKVEKLFGSQGGLSVRVRTATGYEEHEFQSFGMTKNDQLWALLRFPYVGKGSPEAVQVALQLASMNLPGSPPIVTPENFQSYADKWFGVDCNGFVGNYLRHAYHGLPWWDVNLTPGVVGPDDLITDIWTKFGGTERRRSSEIDAGDLNLLVLVDQAGKVIPGGGPTYGHIGISGPGERATIHNLENKLHGIGADGAPAICIVESTGAIADTDHKNGLVKSFYAYVDVPSKPGVFQFHRGLNGKLISMRVKGAPWSS